MALQVCMLGVVNLGWESTRKGEFRWFLI